MKKYIRTHWLVIVITLLGLLVRTWQLNNIPQGLNRDEAALAYNAYLLAQTGQDEWGASWPVALRSFGDYKLAGSVWTMIPFIALFGMSDWAIRLPIALAGAGLVPLTYLLAKRISLGRRSAIAVSALVAFSPVFIFFSRFGFEAILALFWLVAALVLWLHTKPATHLDIVATGIYFLSCLTYNTPLLLAPVIILVVLFNRGITQWRSWWLAIAGIILAASIAFWLVAPATNSKQAITIFSDPTILSEYPGYRAQFAGWQQTIFGNRTIYFMLLITTRLIAFFDPHFLTTTGGAHPWHQIPNGTSHLVVPVYILAVTSVLAAVLFISTHVRQLRHGSIWQANLFTRPEWRFSILLGMLLYALLLPSITVDAPHATRSLFAFVVLCLLLSATYDYIDTSNRHLFTQIKHGVVGLVLMVIILSATLVYLGTYFGTYKLNSARLTKSGLAAAVNQHTPEKITPIIVVDPDGYEYIRVAWDERISAQEFMTTIRREPPNPLGFTPASQVGRYTFVRSEVAVPVGEPYYAWQGEQWQKFE